MTCDGVSMDRNNQQQQHQETVYSYLELSVAATDHSAAAPNLNLHLTRDEATELELVEARLKLDLTELLGANLDDANEARLARRDENDTADGVLCDLCDVARLGQVSGAAGRVDGESVVPEGALDVLSVGGDHVLCGAVTALPRLDEGAQNLPVARVLAVRDEGLDLRRYGHGLGPEVAHVVALAGVVPGLQLEHVGLHVEDLAEAVLEVVLAAAVPVVALAEVLELDGRHTHHEDLLSVARSSLERLVVRRRDNALAGAGGLP